MPRFKFRLASLLRLREQSREQAQLVLAEALGRVDAIARWRTDVDSELHELEQHMRTSAKKSSVDVDRLLDGHRHQLSLEARMAELDRAMGEACDEVERCRLKLVEADRDVKVLEKLHEKQLAEHQRHVVHEEQKQNDETAVMRAARRA